MHNVASRMKFLYLHRRHGKTLPFVTSMLPYMYLFLLPMKKINKGIFKNQFSMHCRCTLIVIFKSRVFTLLIYLGATSIMFFGWYICAQECTPSESILSGTPSCTTPSQTYKIFFCSTSQGYLEKLYSLNENL